jgi:hypothetical protein
VIGASTKEFPAPLHILLRPQKKASRQNGIGRAEHAVAIFAVDIFGDGERGILAVDDQGVLALGPEPGVVPVDGPQWPQATLEGYFATCLACPIPLSPSTFRESPDACSQP